MIGYKQTDAPNWVHAPMEQERTQEQEDKIIAEVMALATVACDDMRVELDGRIFEAGWIDDDCPNVWEVIGYKTNIDGLLNAWRAFLAYVLWEAYEIDYLAIVEWRTNQAA